MQEEGTAEGEEGRHCLSVRLGWGEGGWEGGLGIEARWRWWRRLYMGQDRGGDGYGEDGSRHAGEECGVDARSAEGLAQQAQAQSVPEGRGAEQRCRASGPHTVSTSTRRWRTVPPSGEASSQNEPRAPSPVPEAPCLLHYTLATRLTLFSNYICHVYVDIMHCPSHVCSINSLPPLLSHSHTSTT